MRASHHGVVLVDNEIEFLTELSEFMASDTRTIAQFTNPMHAIFHAKSNIVDTLVADFDMPDINGVQLASAFFGNQPKKTDRNYEWQITRHKYFTE